MEQCLQTLAALKEPASMSKLIHLGFQKNIIYNLKTKGYVRILNERFQLTEKGKSFLKQNKVKLTDVLLERITSPTTLGELCRLLPDHTKEQIKSALDHLTTTGKLDAECGVYKPVQKTEGPMFNKLKEKLFGVPEVTEEPKKSDVVIVDEIEKIVLEYNEPMSWFQVDELLEIKVSRSTIQGSLSYLASQDRLQRVGPGLYAPKTYSGIILNKDSITKMVLDKISYSGTGINELREKLPHLTSSQITAAAGYLKQEKLIETIRKGFYKKTGEEEISLADMMDQEVALTSMLEPAVVDVKLGDLAKARKLGGDFMLAFHMTPAVLREVGWNEEQKLHISWKPISQQLMLAPVNDSPFHICRGDDRFVLGCPAKEGKLPKPGPTAKVIPHTVQDNKLVLDMRGI